MRAYFCAALTGAIIIAGGALAASAAASEGRPYGLLPEAMTWRAPPTDLLILPGDGGCARYPRAMTEVDAWLTDKGGRPIWRLRQRGRTFRHGGRTLVRYSRARLICSAPDASRYQVVVYGWRS